MIRKYRKEDIPYIVELEEKTLGTTLGQEMLISDLNNEMSHYYVYEQDNNIIGYISLVFDGYAVEVLNFCIDNAYQNRGYGRKFLCEILDIYYNLKASNIILEVRSSNLRAIHLYHKLGFKQISVRKEYYSNKEDAFVLQKLFIPIEDMEDSYLQCFAKFEYYGDFVRVCDDIQKDKYMHNFYRLDNNDKINELIQLPFTNYIQFMSYNEIKNNVVKTYNKEHYVYMHANIFHISSLKNNRNYRIEKASEIHRKELEQLLYKNALIYGDSYAKNNAKRLVSMAIDNKKIEYFVIYNQENAMIGALHCYIYKDFAKIEDYYILEQYRHQGYGNALFMYVIEYLKIKNVKDIVLTANALDTCKEMYKKMGFSICGQYYLYRKVF